ncbi:hypothetical protein PC116_g18229 [Phytophthora cactorum]|uniref:Uncharacterized protein n=1 Tax=Phytophthora cactorum TaxID=29920 RepID=A0A329RLK1_9STRA|nr:hypothetical protein PC111_g20654 [Phytophthora cactorum]KAG2816158.1 hypothetical protein PC112_g13566 [Phytophthora cactorum]KAG2842923.1 hypothetical protein PC113_g18704 [Phytophthora cactorum]KAG2907615.1 hypothetical protein PC117_g20170 [Phytophthora cactorum]KAG2981191.1 hypothetical protein PC118_g10740 [Phytophthora cactorum]
MSIPHTWTVKSGSDPFPHSDFPVADRQIFANHVNVPAGVIIALHTMTINLYGWNRLVVDRYRLEKYTLKAGDIFIYRVSMAYQVDDPASLYVHALLKPKQSAKQPMVELINTFGEVKSLLKVVLDKSVTCPMAGCGYTPWANVSNDNIAKHLQREHGIRRAPWRETVKGGVPISAIVLT